MVNPKGGNTEFADMRAAYDALDDETKAEIEDMICEHSLMYSRGSLGFLDYTDEEKAAVQAGAAAAGAHPPGARPQVAVSVVACRRHPGHDACRKRGCCCATSTSTPRSAEFVHVHKWTLHDLVMWDNRQTMHRVRRYDQSQPRDMRRATVAGTQPTVAQQAAE